MPAVQFQPGDLIVEPRFVVREPPPDLGIGHTGAAREHPRERHRPIRVHAARITRRSLASSGLRNGEQTACQTADSTPASRGNATCARYA